MPLFCVKIEVTVEAPADADYQQLAKQAKREVFESHYRSQTGLPYDTYPCYVSEYGSTREEEYSV